MDIIIQKEGFEGKNISYEIDKVEIKSDILLNELEKGTKEKTRIFGTIRSSDKRDPVNNASITLSIEGTQIAAITSDELGGYEYTAEEDYTGQTLDFVIQKEGFLRKDISHEIDRFEIESDFLMDEMEIKIEGKICDETDSPLDNASISFSIGNSTIDLVSDKDGYFSFTVGQQFLNQSIGYEVDKEGFKIKSGKLKLLENLKCINISKSIPPTVPDKTWIKNVVVGIGLIGLTVLVIYLFGLAGDPELTIDPDSMNFYFEPDTQAQELSIWNSEFSIWNFGRGTLEWYVYSDTDWIIISPDSGTDSGTVSVSVNSAGMDPGMYTGRVTVESNGGTERGRVSLYIQRIEETTDETTSEPPRIHYFIAEPNHIDGLEGETTLSWEVTGATSVTIDGVGPVEVSKGSIDTWVEQTTTFILRATNEDGISDVRTTLVYVGDEPVDSPVIHHFTAEPNHTDGLEGETTLSWEVSGATSVTINGIGDVGVSVGSIQTRVYHNTTFIIIAMNDAGISDVRTITVTVKPEELLPQLSVDPDTLSFDFGSMNKGETDYSTFTIENIGGGILNWNITNDKSWITVTPTSGTDSDFITVFVDTTYLKLGEECSGNILIKSNGGDKTGDIRLIIDKLYFIEYNVSKEEDLIVKNGLCENGKKNCETDDNRKISGGRYYGMVEDRVAVNGNPRMLADLISVDDKMILNVGEAWVIGEGLTLQVNEIDIKSREVCILLAIDGEKIDSRTTVSGEVYTYCRDIKGDGTIRDETNVPVFVVYIDTVFRDKNTNLAQLRYAWAISTDITIVEKSKIGGI